MAVVKAWSNEDESWSCNSRLHFTANFYQISSTLIDSHPLSSTDSWIHFHSLNFYQLSSTLIKFHPLLSTFIHSTFINSHHLSSTLITFHPLSSTLIHFHQLLSPFIHSHQLPSPFIHFHQLLSPFIHSHQHLSPSIHSHQLSYTQQISSTFIHLTPPPQKLTAIYRLEVILFLLFPSDIRCGTFL